MTHEWIIDVLTDLKAFAVKNGLKATAAQLDDVRLVALAELSNAMVGQAETPGAYEVQTRKPTHYPAKSDLA